MGILTSVGVLKNNKITQTARERFVNDTNLLLLNGSGALNFPVPSILVFEGSPQLSTPFNIQPIEQHRETFTVWHKIFIDTLFEKTAQALDVEGSRPLAPIMDPSSIALDLGINLKPDIGFGDILPKILLPLPPPGIFTLFDLDITDIDLLAELAIKLPDLVSPVSFPKIPDLPVPPDIAITLEDIAISGVPVANIRVPELPFDLIGLSPPLHLPDLRVYNIFDIVKCFFTKVILVAIPTLIASGTDLVQNLVENGPFGLFTFIFGVVVSLLLSCLTDVGFALENALSFVAAFLVYIKNVVAMLAVDLVGMLLGDGLLAKGVADALNLV